MEGRGGAGEAGTGPALRRRQRPPLHLICSRPFLRELAWGEWADFSPPRIF